MVYICSILFNSILQNFTYVYARVKYIAIVTKHCTPGHFTANCTIAPLHFYQWEIIVIYIYKNGQDISTCYKTLGQLVSSTFKLTLILTQILWQRRILNKFRPSLKLSQKYLWVNLYVTHIKNRLLFIIKFVAMCSFGQ